MHLYIYVFIYIYIVRNSLYAYRIYPETLSQCPRYMEVEIMRHESLHPLFPTASRYGILPYIYHHLPYKSTECRQIFQIRGWYGFVSSWCHPSFQKRSRLQNSSMVKSPKQNSLKKVHLVSISSPSPSPAGRILWTAGIFPKEFSILPVRPFFKEKNSTFSGFATHLRLALAPHPRVVRYADLRSCLSFESPGRWRTWSLRVGKESEFGSSRTKTEGKRCYKSLAEWEDASRVTHLFWKFWKKPPGN